MASSSASLCTGCVTPASLASVRREMSTVRMMSAGERAPSATSLSVRPCSRKTTLVSIPVSAVKAVRSGWISSGWR